MANTYALMNLSGQSAESVNIKPFDRSAFVEVDTQLLQGESQASEYRQAGEDPEFPLVSRFSTRNVARVSHPYTDSITMPGRLFQHATATHIQKENSVSGLIKNYPVLFKTQLFVGGGVILDSADVLDYILTHTSAYYPSVSTGTPSPSNLALMAMGGTKLF